MCVSCGGFGIHFLMIWFDFRLDFFVIVEAKKAKILMLVKTGKMVLVYVCHYKLKIMFFYYFSTKQN